MSRRRLLGLGALLFAWALACAPERSLQPNRRVHSLAPASGTLKLDAVARPILRAAGPGEIALPLPASGASRIAIAVGREGEGSAACRARAEVTASPIALELSVEGIPRWVEGSLELPAHAGGVLHLGCEGPAAAAAVWAQPRVLPRDGRAPEPLVVLVSLDTLRADHVDGFGGADALMPALGAFADAGVRMAETRSEGTWTLSSHYALLYSRLYGFAVEPGPLVSVTQAFSDAGFRTVAFTGGGFMGTAFNVHRGFDRFAEYGTGRDGLPDVLRDVLRWLRDTEVPTFVFLHSFAAHELPPSESAWHEARGQFTVFRPNAQQVGIARDWYRKIVRRTDAELAPLLDALAEVARERPVLLVVVSDHGEAFGEHDNFRHGFGDRHVTLHDEVIRVPMVVWGPGVVAPGVVSRRPTMLSDVAPSILAAVGVEAPPAMRGQNLWPLWSGRGDSALPAARGSVSHTDGAWALRTQDAKLIARLGPRGRARHELYALADDPGETRNLAPERREEVARLRRALRARLAEEGVPLPAPEFEYPRCTLCGWQDRSAFWRLALGEEARDDAEVPDAAVDAETLQRLRELGYLD